MSHHRGHHHHHSDENIQWAFFLNLSFTIIELIGGLMVNSMAILSDAIHDLGDSISLGLAWWLERRSRRPADHRYSFGYKRFSLLSALISGLVIIIGAVFIIPEAVGRLIHPQEAHAQGMMWLAILGVAVNGYASYRLSHGASMNEQVIRWHLLEDALGWLVILLAAILLQFVDLPWLDPLLSITISVYILYGVVKRLIETIHLFLQGMPKDIDPKAIQADILSIEGVEALHDLRLWSLDGADHVMSCHIITDRSASMEDTTDIRRLIEDRLSTHSIIYHTLQFEYNPSQPEQVSIRSDDDSP